MSKKGGGDGIYTQKFKCAVCGKERFKNGSWIYKRLGYPNTKFFCGYNCMNKFDKAVKEQKEAKQREKEAKKAEHDKARAATDKAL